MIGTVDKVMAITAIQPHLFHMKAVIKSDRLGRLITDARVFGGKVVGHAGNDHGSRDCQGDNQLKRDKVY